MKLIKFPQSCILLDDGKTKLLIDPGILKFEEKFVPTWSSADAVLITHKHADHCHVGFLKDYSAKCCGKIFSTDEVKTATDLNITVKKTGNKFTVGNFKIEVVKAVHGYNPNLKGGKLPLENVGFLINYLNSESVNKTLYITSDTICFEYAMKADVVINPVTGHGLTMTAYEAALNCKELGATLMIVVHLDNEMYPVNISEVKKYLTAQKINYQIPKILDELELD